MGAEVIGLLRRLFGWNEVDSSPEGNWAIVAFGPNFETRAPIEGSRPSIVIEGARLAGTTGLNRIGGHFDGTFPLEPLAVTRMAGPPDLMEQESAILGFLQVADGFRLEGDTMSLTKGGETVIELQRSGSG